MPRRTVTKPAGTFEERCIQRAEEKEEKASALPPGNERELLLKEAHQLRNAVSLDGWLKSSELKPPS